MTKALHRSESGFVSIEFMVAVAFSFLLLVMLSNIVVVQYGRGLVRAAVDEGARAGARLSADSVASCRNRANDVLNGAGGIARNVKIECAISGNQMRATAAADFEGWLPAVPTFHEDAVATAGRVRQPL